MPGRGRGRGRRGAGQKAAADCLHRSWCHRRDRRRPWLLCDGDRRLSAPRDRPGGDRLWNRQVCTYNTDRLTENDRKIAGDCEKKMIVEMLIFPHLSYCTTVWAGCNKTQRHRLQKVINHCAQVVKGARRSAHASPLIAELNWPSFDSLIAERDVAQVHYLLNHLQAPTGLTAGIVHRSDVSVRETRAAVAGLLQLPRMRTEHARRFFSSRAPALWNRAPAEVREARSAAQ